MSAADWDSTLKIGQKYRGGSAPRATVARTQSEVSWPYDNLSSTRVRLVSNAAIQINAARRAGAIIATEKKYTGGQNKVGNTEGQHLTKVDRENEVAPPKTVDKEVGKAMAAARQAKQWTQKDLGTKVNEKPSVINDYEAGRAIPSQQVLGKLERALGVKLRGKDIGQPLGGPKKK